MKKCVFLDRDGVINKDINDYVWRLKDFELNHGVEEAIQKLKEKGYLLIIITNQAGIAKQLYTHQDVLLCHDKLQKLTDNSIDDLYYSPYHESTSNSLTRKPGSLSFEKAIAKYKIDINESWMIGDMERDLIPAKKIGLKTGLVKGRIKISEYADCVGRSLYDIVNNYILT